MRRLAAQGILLARTLRAVARHGLPWREVGLQLDELGNHSVFVIALGMAFFGAVMVTSADQEARPIIQDIALAGPPYFQLLVREVAPILVGALASLKLGSMIAAEVGAMTATEQVEALRLCSGDPYAELVAPRVLAGLITLPILTTVGLLAAGVSAALVALLVYGSDGWAWLDPEVTSRVDVALCFAKALLFGAAIPLAACGAGLRATGGSSSIGQATTQGAVDSFLAMLFIDVSMTIGSSLLHL